MEKSNVTHFKDCFTKLETTDYFNRLLTNIPWEYMQWTRGKNLPRQTFSYEFSMNVIVLDELIDEVEIMFECRVRSVWCNLYNNGSEYTPAHQDSYGAHVITLSFDLADGDIFYFSPEFNKNHKHSVPKSKTTEARVSVVFFTTEPFVEKNTLRIRNGGKIVAHGADLATIRSIFSYLFE